MFCGTDFIFKRKKMVNHIVETHNVFGYQNALIALIKEQDETVLRKIVKPNTRYIFEIGEGNKCVLWIEDNKFYYFTNKETNYEGDTTEITELIVNRRKTSEELIVIIGNTYKKIVDAYIKDKTAHNKEKVAIFEKLMTDIGLNYVEIEKWRN